MCNRIRDRNRRGRRHAFDGAFSECKEVGKRVTLVDEGAPRDLSEQNRREGERLSESDLCEERENDDGLFGDKQNSEHTVFAPLILCLIPVEKMLVRLNCLCTGR